MIYENQEKLKICFGNYYVLDSNCDKCELKNECLERQRNNLEKVGNFIEKMNKPECFGKRYEKDHCGGCDSKLECKTKYLENVLSMDVVVKPYCFSNEFDIENIICQKCKFIAGCETQTREKTNKILEDEYKNNPYNKGLSKYIENQKKLETEKKESILVQPALINKNEEDKQELVTLFKTMDRIDKGLNQLNNKIDKFDKDINNRLENTNEKLNKIGKDLAEINNDLNIIHNQLRNPFSKFIDFIKHLFKR